MIKVPLPDKQLEERLHLFFDDSSNSTQQDHRLNLRNKLAIKLNEASIQYKKEEILDLSKHPQSEEQTISLSHCQQACGFIFSTNNARVGLDLESCERINDALVKRVSKPHELGSCPKPHLLFSAKEAAWKAINQPLNLQTITQIETVSWKATDSKWNSFKLQIDDQNLDGQGYICQISGVYLSFFYCPSTFI